MPYWINCQVHYLFQALVNQLETFHEVCGKSKQKDIYSNLADTLFMTCDLLFQETIPEGPDVRLASISGVIQTQLELLTKTKVGTENTDLFIYHYGASLISLNKFTQTYNQYLTQYHLNPDSAKNTFKEMEKFLIPQKKLRKKILSLTVCRKEKNDPFTLFKRSSRHSTKLMVTSGVLVAAGIFTFLLSIMDHTIGPAIDKYLDQKIEKRMDYKDLVGTAYLAIALILFIIAMIKNYRSNPELLDNMFYIDNNANNTHLKNMSEIDANEVKVIELEEDDNKHHERSLLLN